ncbi:MAG: DUF2806 domain-containing protein [Thiobacillus sp.]
MNNNLPSVPNIARAAWGIVKAIGPFLISQTEKGSEAYAQHQMRLAHVEVCKELMLGEIHTLNEVRRKLIEKYYDAPEDERFRIKRDLQDIEKDTRRLGVYQKALEYLPAEDEASTDNNATGTISPSWMDRFNEVAQLQNEAWRQELLSKALAREAQNPGSISPRALWFIGTVDDQVFHAFASLIDVSSIILGRYMIPNHTGYYGRVLPDCVLGEDFELGNITFLLNDLGVIGDLLTSQRKIPAASMFLMSYGQQHYTLKAKQEMRVSGIVLTPLGEIIASLYEPKPNELGAEIFDAWVKSIRPDTAEVLQLRQAGQNN